MSMGKIVASIEIIVSVWGSLALAESLGKFRWEKRFAKALFYMAVLLRTSLGILNLHWGKFTDIGLIIFSIYLLMILLIFYHIDVFKIIILHLLYWFSIMMFQITCLFVTSYVHSLILRDYIYDTGEVVYPYYGIYIAGMCLEIAGICLFIRFIKGKKILADFDVWFYAGCIPIIICEVFIDYFFLDEMTFKRIESYILFLELLLIWTLISGSLIIVLYYRYVQIKQRWNRIDMNMEQLSAEYEFMIRSYEEKRRQVHDNTQHDIMVLGMIENHQYEKAVAYLKEKGREKKAQNKYTGSTVIDIMLNHKILTAKDYQIRVEVSADVYNCSLKDRDLCVILGNLLDNAIEAVKDLPKQQRWIKIMLKSPNNIFMLEITNPYKGIRKKRHGHYLTTKKENSHMHGIGLCSVEKIVMDYEGDMQISSDDNVFKVMVTIFL